MRETPNLLLKLPDPTDYVLVEDLNENFTKLDTEIAKITDEETGVEAKLTKHLDDNVKHLTQAEHEKLTNVEVGANKTVLNNTVTSTSTTQAATANAVKTAYDRAEQAFTQVSNGKQLIGTAITDVDDSLIVPADPTFQNLADLIGNINTGKKWASGTATVSSSTFNFQYAHNTEVLPMYYFTVNSLTFKPSFILAYVQSDSGRGYLTVCHGMAMNVYSGMVANVMTFVQKNGTIHAMKGDASPAYINPTSFRIPMYNDPVAMPGKSASWIAFE